MTRQQQTQGKHGQNEAASLLAGWGLAMIEQIGTPVKLIPYGANKNIFRVIWGETVSGDHRAILPGGRSVLIETKTVYDRNLRYSDLRPHQPERLSKHAAIGGLSLLCWVHDVKQNGVFVMEWTKDGIEGFAPGKSLTKSAGHYQHIKTENMLRVLCDVFYKDGDNTKEA